MIDEALFFLFIVLWFQLCSPLCRCQTRECVDGRVGAVVEASVTAARKKQRLRLGERRKKKKKSL
jgi:hypothetical protein